MAKRTTAYREWQWGWRGARPVLALGLAAAAGLASSAAFGQAASQPPTTASRPTAAHTIAVPRIAGRLTAKDIGLVINTLDPYSVEVGEHYIAARKLRPEQVLRVGLPVRPVLSPDTFEALRQAIDEHFGPDTQALALAWSAPYAVGCNSITGALALGFDPGMCVDAAHSCAPTRPSPYFNARTARPYTDLKLRPSMLIAARDVAGAKALIDRGVKADHSLGLRGAPPAHAHFVVTSDRARSTRAPLFPPAGPMRGVPIAIHVDKAQALENAERVLVYQTGATQVDKLDTLDWLPGALADHVTSFGGKLDGSGGQMSALAWIHAGATASYGTVSEPCSYPQKFPHPQVLLLNYAQGSSALEAYWKSVAWPLQGVFVGEPLAAPFAKR
jgi:uncharacterized protein (TIGR03790 family)